MCTVSWLHSEDGYQLLCNRDEKRSRLPASGPAVRNENGVRFLAPIDGDFGGSWIAVNEYGVTIALLNRHFASPCGTASRGLLVRSLAVARSIEEIGEMVEGEDLSKFAGFALVALEAGKPSHLFEWDGRRLMTSQNAEHRMPLTSSSFDPGGVADERLREFSARVRAAKELDVTVLSEFHQSHGLRTSTPSAYSTCMHRSDAHTVSFSWIDVSSTEVIFFYSPAAPCMWAPGETVRLVRKVRSLAA